MTLETFYLSINKPVKGNFHLGGETLAGNVKIIKSESIRAKELVVKVLGIATTRWTELRTEYRVCYSPMCINWHHCLQNHCGCRHNGMYYHYDRNHYYRYYDCNNYNSYQHCHPYTVRVTRSCENTFFSKEIKLWKDVDGSKYFSAGETNFTFRCALPDDIPSTYYNINGDISYKVEATIVKPWWYWSNETTTSAFSVLHSIDLNAHPSLLVRKVKAAEKMFCCWWCKSGPLSVVLTLPVSGVVLGDKLKPIVEVDNASDVVITNVTLSFIRKDNYLYHCIAGEDEEIVLETQLGFVRANTSTLWDKDELSIPNLQPRRFSNYVVTSTKYYVKVVCVPSGPHQELSVELPVVVGTIPFKNLQNHTGLIKRRKIE